MIKYYVDEKKMIIEWLCCRQVPHSLLLLFFWIKSVSLKQSYTGALPWLYLDTAVHGEWSLNKILVLWIYLHIADYFGKRVFEGCCYQQRTIEVSCYGSPSRWLPGSNRETLFFLSNCLHYFFCVRKISPAPVSCHLLPTWNILRPMTIKLMLITLDFHLLVHRMGDSMT